MSAALRRGHHRWRPQRPDLRRLPRARRPDDARPRAAPRPRWGGRHRGDRPRLPVQRRHLRRVSLLRPEIIRELELPKHGLDILPLDGTFTPLRPGEAAGRRLPVAGRTTTAATMRELRRWSKSRRRGVRGVRPADGRDGPVHQADPRHRPARPDGRDPRALLPARRPARALRGSCRSASRRSFVQLMTMSAADFLDQWFETDPLKATMSASGIIGTFQGVRSPGHGVRAAAPLHGRDRRRVPRLGHPRAAPAACQHAIAAPRAALGAEIRTEAPVARIAVRGRPGDGRRPRVRRGDRGVGRPLQRRRAR